MRRALVLPEKGALAMVVGWFAAIVMAPVAFLLKLATLPCERPFSRSPEEVARYLRNFRDQSGGPWDWDDFTGLPLMDPRLDHVRKRAATVTQPVDDEGMGLLAALIVEVEGIAAMSGVESGLSTRGPLPLSRVGQRHVSLTKVG